MRVGLLIAPGLACLWAGPAMASDSVSFRIRAEVAPFCRLWAEQDPSASIRLDGAQAQLGAVREVCNMAGGYVVRARFSGLSSASVMAGDDVRALDADGTVSFRNHEAGARTRAWRLADARGDENAPITMRLTISPL